MSNAALTAVFERSRTRHAARLVMLALADRADDRGRAWPSIADLMRRTGISRGALHNAICEAVRLEELTVEKFAGPRLCNIYILTVPPRSESEPVQNLNPVQILNRPVQIQDTTRSDSEPKPSLTPKNPQSLDRTRGNPKAESEDAPDFASFWQAYPRKTAKAQAAKAWRATARYRPPFDELLAALERHKGSRQWVDAQYIPYPATWLHGHRWADELPVAETAKTRVRL